MQRSFLFPKPLTSPDQPALIAITETGAEQTLSYADLRREVARCAAALKREGIGIDDRVSAFATNTPETVILLLACASLGAVFSSCSPDFGLDAAASRFGQIEPKLLFASPFYAYGGKRFEALETVRKLAEGMAKPRAGCAAAVSWGRPSSPLEQLGVCLVGRVARASNSLDLRATSLRPPAVHPVFLRYDGFAQGHRPPRGRRAAQAPLGTAVTLRHQTRRPGVLLFDLRLDDVELAGVGARSGRDGGAV